MPLMTSYEFGDIVLVPFLFTDQTTTKRRPAVVVSATAYHREKPDLILMAVTGQVRASLSVGEVVIRDWQQAGLIKPQSSNRFSLPSRRNWSLGNWGN